MHYNKRYDEKQHKRDRFNTKVYYTSEDIIYRLRETQIEEQKDAFTEAQTKRQTDE